MSKADEERERQVFLLLAAGMLQELEDMRTRGHSTLDAETLRSNGCRTTQEFARKLLAAAKAGGPRVVLPDFVREYAQ